tara:strand:+ start:3178 stop:6012 length:2835 start_codon:yes stop_codon:yes gene_type:complete
MVEYNDDEVFRVFVEKGEQGLEDLIIDKDPDKSDAELDLLIEQLTEKVFSNPDMFNRYIENKDEIKSKILTAKNKYRKGSIPTIDAGKPKDIKLELIKYFARINYFDMIPKNYLDIYIEKFMSEKMEIDIDKYSPYNRKAVKDILGRDARKILDRILKYFISKRTNKTVSYKQLFDSKSVNMQDVGVNYNKIDELKNKSDKFLQDLTSEKDGKMLFNSIKMQELKPIIDLIKLVNKQSESETKNLKTQYLASVRVINAADITGNLNLKELSSRDSIYNYWSNSDKYYDKFTKSYVKFLDKLKELEDDELVPELDEIIYSLKKYESDIKSSNIRDNLKYTVNVNTRTLKAYMKKQKHLALLEDILLDPKYGGFMKPKQMPEMSVVQTEGGFTNKETGEKTSQSSSYLPSRENKGVDEISSEEYTQLGIILENFSTGDIQVDPLYHYAFTHPSKGAFTRTPVLEEDLKLIKKQLRNRGRQISTVVNEEIGFAIDDGVANYMDDLQELVPSKKEDFILPLSDKLLNGHKKEGGYSFKEGNITSKDFENKGKKIGDFLGLIAKLYGGDGMSSPSFAGFDSRTDKRNDPKTGTAGKDKVPFSERLSVNIGNDNGTDYVKDLKSVNDELKKLLTAILDYFILPASSRYMPFDEPSIFAGQDSFIKTLRVLGGVNKNDSAFSRLMYMARGIRGGKFLVNATQLQDFTELIKELSKPKMSMNIKELEKLIVDKGIEPTLDVLRSVKMDNVQKDVHEEFGSYFYRILKRNNKYSTYKRQEREEFGNPDGNFPESDSSASPLEYHQKYEDNTRKNYAFEAIVKHVIDNREAYLDFGEEGKTKGRGKAKNETIYTEFYNAVRDLDIIKSETELKILDAHDSIRKMMGKPVYFNTSKLDNFEHANEAIDIMKKSFNIDITAHEISQIVNEVNSFEEISIKHGVPKEGVYFLKGTFR